MKMATNDMELLHRYARQGSEESFTALVQRHLDLVYSAALRQVRAPELAQEVAQSVFIELSRSADKIKPDSILTAWLYHVTRRRAIDVVRRESRRQLREQIAWEMNDMNSTTSDWTQIEPLLDEAMEALDETDRGAVLLRYFQNKSLREVGHALGTSEDAAQKRVSRALDRLRDFFSARKVSVAAAGLATAISVNAVEAAPLGLSATISAAAVLSGGAVHAVTTIGVTKAIAMTTIQKALIAAAITATLGTGIYGARRASILEGQIQTLQQQAAGQETQAAQERDDAMKKLAALQSENDQLRSQLAALEGDSQELAQMKAEDAASAKDPAQTALGLWLNRVDRLKQRLKQMPLAQIPEMQFLTDEDWLKAAQGNLDTDGDYRRALSDLRTAGESKFSGMLQPALQSYMNANNQQFPTNLSQLQSYFNPPVDPAILQRYSVLPASTVPNVTMGGDWIITQTAAVDADYDSRVVIGPNGYGASGQGFLPPIESLMPIVNPVMKAYSAANNGGQPTDLSQLLPYATTPEQQAALQTIIRRKGAGGN
jgi:RNA polymerase sigma factor (sigma-70 family)